MNHLSGIAAMLAATMLTAGCAVYEPPSSGPRAKAVFAGQVTSVFLYTADSCAGRKGLPASQMKDTVVPAGQWLGVQVGFHESRDPKQMWCEFAVALEPRDGETYVFELKVDWEASRCAPELRYVTMNPHLAPPTMSRWQPPACL